jgi:hypothetical protein
MGRLIEEKGLPYPVALDSRFTNWLAFEEKYGEIYTGMTYLFDKEGNMRYKVGIGEYNTLEERIQELLAEG